MVRLGLLPNKGHIESLARHVNDLQVKGLHVLYVTADTPCNALVNQLAGGGVDTSHLSILDAVSCLSGSVPREYPANTTFVASPTMLEMMALRVGKMTANKAKTWYVVVDSLNALSLYNGVGPVQEFTHYLVNDLRGAGIDGTLIIRDSPEGRNLRRVVAQFTDGVIDLEGVV